MSEAGYFVFLPNPRGSQGRGETFTRANVRDFGILAGVDTVLARYPVDPARLGITGGSYGGCMTMWAVTQTTRFKAAVPTAGIANWLSYAGENGITTWTVPYFGATVYADPARYARSAPITFITRARTPALILVGERDTECPPAQSFEFWRGLEAAGVPAQLVVYADEGHGLTQPAHVRDARARAWFGRYLNGDRAGTPATP